jgi:2-oxoglutarate ferredoxin oxidoreductase subunit alpha
MTETMTDIAVKPRPAAGKAARPAQSAKKAVTLREHIVEIVSDSGEGAQRCGQTFGAIASQMGNGVWTEEIIPAEIRPPARSVAGGSGNRIRIGAGRVTNAGNETDLVIAFNEQVLLGRVRTGELKPDCTILLESMWRESRDPKIVESYVETYDQLVKAGYKVIEIPMERSARPSSPTPSAARTCLRSVSSATFSASTVRTATSRLPSLSARKTSASSNQT